LYNFNINYGGIYGIFFKSYWDFTNFDLGTTEGEIKEYVITMIFDSPEGNITADIKNMCFIDISIVEVI
jgi:hypothetical protein